MSITAWLRRNASERPHALAVADLATGAAWSHADLLQRASAIAAEVSTYAEEGARAVLLYEAGLEVHAAFWGCMLARRAAVILPIPLQPRDLVNTRALVEDAGTSVILSTTKAIAAIEEAAGPLGAALGDLRGLGDLRERLGDLREPVPRESRGLPIVPTESLAGGDFVEVASVSTGALRSIFYTSGSTGEPKGVALTDANLRAWGEAGAATWAFDPAAITVSWLPLHHSFGLLFNVLVTTCGGGALHVMQTQAFSRAPRAWLGALSRVRATHTASPNFGYRLAVSEVALEARAGLDLSSLRVALSGGEPIHATDVARFEERYAPCGLRSTVFSPIYGITETGPLVTARPEDRTRFVTPRSGSSAVAGCGRPSPGFEVRIVDPSTGGEAPSGAVGEVWVAGAGLSLGYWKRPDETAQRFVVTDDGTRWFRTGDLAFVDGGEVFVCGRSKEVLIIHGKKFHPLALERELGAAIAALRPLVSCLVQTVGANGDRLVLLLESSAPITDLRSIGAQAIALLSRRHGLGLDDVLVVVPGALPRTPSGKLRRSACAEALVAGALPIVTRYEAAPREGSDGASCLTADVIRLLEARIGAPVDVDGSLGEYGLDSLDFHQLAARLEELTGQEVRPTIFLRAPTIADLCAQLARGSKGHGAAPAVGRGEDR